MHAMNPRESTTPTFLETSHLNKKFNKQIWTALINYRGFYARGTSKEKEIRQKRILD